MEFEASAASLHEMLGGTWGQRHAAWPCGVGLVGLNDGHVATRETNSTCTYLHPIQRCFPVTSSMLLAPGVGSQNSLLGS